MALPISYPVSPMLARLDEHLPTGDGWLYEPKWDGFRGILFRGEDRSVLQSRNGKDLGGSFPEILEAAAALPEPCVIDGEIVATKDGRLDFGGLQSRFDGSSTTPVSFVAFDLLASGRTDVRGSSFSMRRRALETLVPPSDVIFITPQSDRLDVAQEWLHGFFDQGFEGVVAKRAASTYRGGVRSMIKVKSYRTVDLVVGGFAGQQAAPTSLLVGAYDPAGRLHHVGTAKGFDVEKTAEMLAPLLSQNGAGFDGATPAHGRWQSLSIDEWVPVRPLLVCEVAYNRVDGHRLRHSVRFLRWRPDKEPSECGLEQLRGARL